MVRVHDPVACGERARLYRRLGGAPLYPLMADAILLGDWIGRAEYIDLACSRCPRRGRLNVARLVAQYGATYPGPKLLAVLSADCPRRAPVIPLAELCGIHTSNAATL